MKKTLTFCAVAAGLAGGPALTASAADGNRAHQAIASGRWFEAEDMLRQDLVRKPNDPAALLDLAFVLRNTGRQREAVGVYQRVVRLADDPVFIADDGTRLTAMRAKSLGRSGVDSLEWANP